MDEVEESWNKKRIITAFIVVVFFLVTGGYFLKERILDKSLDFFRKKSVLSSKSEEAKDQSSKKNGDATGLDIDLQKALREKLDALKREVANLNIADIATSSPQVIKVLNDLNALKDYPRNEAKDICEKLCRGL